MCFLFLSGISFTETDASREAGEERAPSLFLSSILTRSRLFRHLFATFHVRGLPNIFNRTDCNYQTATGQDLPPWGITVGSIVDGDETLISVHLIISF